MCRQRKAIAVLRASLNARPDSQGRLRLPRRCRFCRAFAAACIQSGEGQAVLLLHVSQQLCEPLLRHIEGFAALEPRKLDRPQHAVSVFIVADLATLATEDAIDGQADASLDQAWIVGIGRCLDAPGGA